MASRSIFELVKPSTTLPLAAAPRAPRLRELFDEHAAFVCRSLRRLGVADADLDDVVQEVFLVVHRRLDAYQERGRAQAWLYSICTRVAQGQRRKNKRRRESVVMDVPDVPIPAGQLASVEDREARALGEALLKQLPAEQREVFVLYEVEDMPMSEIARALGCPLQTAYSRLHAARRRILDELASANAGGHDDGP